jgi:hypothetical protein
MSITNLAYREECCEERCQIFNEVKIHTINLTLGANRMRNSVNVSGKNCHATAMQAPRGRGV